MCRFVIILMTAVLFGTALGQWSADSTVNLQICDLSGEQVLPKIMPTSDGGCFISWFDQRNGDYCVYLQRLDSQGVPQFAENGLLVSDQPQQTWLVDYSMAVDGDNNAVIAFSDVRNESGELDVSVYKISSLGEFLWGADGICLSNPAEPGFEPNPMVTVTDQGNCVVAWGKSTSTDFLVFQKIAPDGTKLWGDWGITLESASADLSAPVVVASGQDSVIAMWKSSTGTYPMTVTHLYTDMLDVGGAFVWGDSPVLIYDSGAISPWTFPGMISDGEGGAVCFWYDAPSVSAFNVWVQHLDPDGAMLYPMNGAQASTNSDNRLHMSPSAAYNPGEAQSYAFWVETDGNQNLYGVYGQRFSQTGDRMWTDNGLELIPLGGLQISFVNTVLDQYGIFVSYLINPAYTSLRVIKLSFEGSVLWGPVTISAGSLGGKDDQVVCPGYNSSVFFAWADDRTDKGIYAQNIQQDGSLGPYLGIGSTSPGDVLPVMISPNPASGSTNIRITLDTPGEVVLEVFSITGRLMETLVSGQLCSGEHSVPWTPGPSVPSGVYLVRFSSPGRETVSRLVLL